MALSNEIDLSVEQLPQNPIVLTPADESDYRNLVNKPKINNNVLEGDKTSSELGLASAEQGEKADTAVQPGDLATVATSGSYNDLTDKPTIPTVNDATLTIQKNGTDVATFTANSASNATANITVPTQASDIGAQDTLVSGTNIKTVNGNSLLGSGNVDIDALPSQTGQSGKFLTTDGTDPSWADIPTEVDNKSVSLNSNDEIQTIGVIDQNDTTKAIKTWTGTKAQYEAIVSGGTVDANTNYAYPDSDDISVDINQIATDLNLKAGTDLSNLTNAGKIVGAGLGMPSTTYDNLTLGASGATYTAPADGWFCFYTIKSTQGYTYLSSNTSGFRTECRSTINGAGCGCFLPVKKGEVIVCNYDGVNQNPFWRFYYAEGSKSEAN